MARLPPGIRALSGFTATRAVRPSARICPSFIQAKTHKAPGCKESWRGPLRWAVSEARAGTTEKTARDSGPICSRLPSKTTGSSYRALPEWCATSAIVRKWIRSSLTAASAPDNVSLKGLSSASFPVSLTALPTPATRFSPWWATATTIWLPAGPTGPISLPRSIRCWTSGRMKRG